MNTNNQITTNQPTNKTMKTATTYPTMQEVKTPHNTLHHISEKTAKALIAHCLPNHPRQLPRSGHELFIEDTGISIQYNPSRRISLGAYILTIPNNTTPVYFSITNVQAEASPDKL